MWRSVFGLMIILTAAWLLSENRRRFPVRVVVAGLLLQFGIAAAIFKFPLLRSFFMGLNTVAMSLEQATLEGTSFVFGYLGGGPLPFAELKPGAAYVFAFRSMPLVLLIAALTALLYYWNILPRVVRAFSHLLRKPMKLGGALGVGASATIFIGMIEGPLLIRPYLSRLTRSELFSILSCGMACIAGTVLVIYASMLKGVIPEPLGHILTASIISAPAALAVAAIMIPEERDQTLGDELPPSDATSPMDAISKGTMDGLHMYLQIIAMLTVLLALVKLINLGLSALPLEGFLAGHLDGPLTLERMLGWCFAPLVWLLGVPWSECAVSGQLLGVKTVLNEFIAYVQLASLPPGTLSERSALIMTYALCGFANPGSLGVVIGAFGGMCPERRAEVTALGWKAIIAGTLASCMTGAVVGILF